MRWRSQATPDHIMFTLLNARVRNTIKVSLTLVLWDPSLSGIQFQRESKQMFLQEGPIYCDVTNLHIKRDVTMERSLS